STTRGWSASWSRSWGARWIWSTGPKWSGARTGSAGERSWVRRGPSTMADRDPATVLDLVVAGQRIREFIAGQDYETFWADLKTQSAVVLQILILGEAAKRLSPAFCDRHPEIAWADLMRMRDRLIHHYESLDPQEVWKAATRDVPHLLSVLEPLLPKEPG